MLLLSRHEMVFFFFFFLFFETHWHVAVHKASQIARPSELAGILTHIYVLYICIYNNVYVYVPLQFQMGRHLRRLVYLIIITITFTKRVWTHLHRFPPPPFLKYFPLFVWENESRVNSIMRKEINTVGGELGYKHYRKMCNCSRIRDPKKNPCH